MRLKKKNVFFILFVLTGAFCSSVIQAAETDVVIDTCFVSPTVIELEQQIKEILHERGYSESLLEKLAFSGNFILNEPKLIPKTREGLAQKYTCVAECNITVRYAGSKEAMFRVDNSFFDIGRSESSACKFALGKVIHYFLDETRKIVNNESGITGLEYRLNNQNDLFDKHIEQLYGFMVGMVEEAEVFNGE